MPTKKSTFLDAQEEIPIACENCGEPASHYVCWDVRWPWALEDNTHTEDLCFSCLQEALAAVALDDTFKVGRI